ncbi:putative GCN5-related N-acetyltransferase [Rhodospirillaceae bacterium LM-1]|nr:putative GCN5-related N-acetyltransferase [Rhodospirillaceae bacterium LM-1]
MGNPLEFEIRRLAAPKEAQQVATWIYDEWARYEPDMTWENCLAVVMDSIQPGVAIPAFFVARVNAQLVGCSSIIASDLPTRPELGPWLANVLVLPEYRNQGLGGSLIKAAMSHAALLTERLYLYTHDKTELYAKLGWNPLGSDHYAGKNIVLMDFQFSKASF